MLTLCMKWSREHSQGMIILSGHLTDFQHRNSHGHFFSSGTQKSANTIMRVHVLLKVNMVIFVTYVIFVQNQRRTLLIQRQNVILNRVGQ